MRGYMKSRFRLLFICSIVLSLVVSSVSLSFAATKTKKTTAYDQVIKSGKYVYCCDGFRIYRYNLNTKKLLNLTKHTASVDEGYFAMKKKGKYIYCLYATTEETDLYRFSTNKKSSKKLNKGILYSTQYYVSKNKLYYSGYDIENDRTVCKVAKLNGKSQKKSNVVCKVKRKKSNATGYRTIVNNDNQGNVDSWLKLPDGSKIKLGHYTYPTY